MNEHRRDKVGVMGILSDDLVLRNQPLPLGKDRRGIIKEDENGLEAGQFGLGLGRRESKSILGLRPGGHHPKFVKILGRNIENYVQLKQFIYGIRSSCVHGVTRLRKPGKEIGIEEYTHSPRPA